MVQTSWILESSLLPMLYTDSERIGPAYEIKGVKLLGKLSVRQVTGN